jgi:hypothetical protein
MTPIFPPLALSMGLKWRMSAKNKKFWILAMEHSLSVSRRAFHHKNKLWYSKKTLRIFK